MSRIKVNDSYLSILHVMKAYYKKTDNKVHALFTISNRYNALRKISHWQPFDRHLKLQRAYVTFITTV